MMTKICLRKEDHHKASLAYIAKLCLEIIKAKEKKEIRGLQFD